jgi:hypothetical protein
MYKSMLLFNVHAALLTLYCMSMSVLHGLEQAALAWTWSKDMNMQHGHMHMHMHMQMHN